MDKEDTEVKMDKCNGVPRFIVANGVVGPAKKEGEKERKKKKKRVGWK